MSTLKESFSPRALNDCFSRNRSKFRRASSAGVDGVGLVDFDEELTEQISRLSKRILAGSYKHKALKAFSFEKSSGKLRWICVPTICDRLVQRRLAEVLLKDRERFNSSFGFGALSKVGAEAERAATDVALDLRQECEWVVKSDISAFFDQLSRNHVKLAYRKVYRKRSLYNLLDQVINVEAAGGNALQKRMAASGIVRGTGLRQGMPLSPLLAHIALIDLDHELEQQGFRFVRYVDDLAFFGKSKAEVISAFEHARDWLARTELQLHEIGHGKTEIYRPGKSVEFLGLEIYKPKDKYRLRIPKSKFTALDGRFAQRCAIDFDDPDHGAVGAAVRFISTARRSYEGVYKNLHNWQAFEKRIKDCERRSIRAVSRKLGPLGSSAKGLPPQVLKAFGLTP